MPTQHPPYDSATWTLFTDRDGVINYLITGDYIVNWDAFHFIPGAVDAMARLNPLFQRIIIATNQRGIKRELMTEDDLQNIHQRMQAEIEQAGGRIDGIYFCANHPEDDPEDCRKPAIGMARQARADFPEIDFQRSFMLGDNVTDMEFGRNAGMCTVFICADGPPTGSESLVDYHFGSLPLFVAWLENQVATKEG